MTPKEIERYYAELQMKQKRIRENSTYAYGKNHKIYTNEAKPNPDNRIPIPLGKSAVTDITGYAGRPGEIKTEYINITADEPGDEVAELLSLFGEHNKEGLENSELLTTSLSLGMAWELWYTSDKLELDKGMRTPEYVILKNSECLPIFSDDLKPELISFMRFWTSKEKKEYCDIYYPLYSERWVKEKDSWMPEKEGATIYPYSKVPVIQFRTSMYDEPVFEAQKPIIDGLDAIVSNTQNEVDRFAGLTMLFPEKISQTALKKVMEAIQPFFDDLDAIDSDKWPRYMEKNLAGVYEFYKTQAESLERYFHKTIKIPDMSDKEFAGDASGVAIAYKLIGFEFLVSEIEIYFRQGLMDRFDMYKDIIDKSTMTVNWDDYKQEIVWNRNLPVDDEMKVRIASMLQGLGFDFKIIVKYLPNSIVNGMTDEEIKEMLGGDEAEPLEALTNDEQMEDNE